MSSRRSRGRALRIICIGALVGALAVFWSSDLLHGQVIPPTSAKTKVPASPIQKCTLP